jgi:hypothetical protein
VCSWESSRPPKPADGVQILALVLADVAEIERRRFRLIAWDGRPMLVRIQPSALATEAAELARRKAEGGSFELFTLRV